MTMNSVTLAVDGLTLAASVILGVAYLCQRADLQRMMESRDSYQRAYDATVKDRNEKEEKLDQIRGLLDGEEEE